MEKRALKIYFAGDLFDSKDLVGNLMLAMAIEKKAGGRYQVMLPQDGECEVNERTSQSIRDADFELLLSCDVLVANFDGHDLDSGTVVEFCFAKMVDMPAVLLRTDFRNSGDHTLPDGDPWNLMCSHYPGTKVLHINSMQHYHACRNCGLSGGALVEKFYDAIAGEVVQALDEAVARKSFIHREQLQMQYEMAVKCMGGTMKKRLSEEKIKALVLSKTAAGVY
ncbi:MAG: nucleoside 2-deoxyribosyltransferase [Lentisphaeria bacterium]|nr:nucleoside 2-deoxyribosyltransferase [Lentisphaeria bacterium]